MYPAKKLNEKKLDKGNKNFQPSNLEFTSINVDNKTSNVIPSAARAHFNVRFNNLHTSSDLKKKINSLQKEGKTVLNAKSFLAGYKIIKGDILI